MKTVRCKFCGREQEVEDNVVITICYFCQEEMNELNELNNTSKGIRK